MGESDEVDTETLLNAARAELARREGEGEGEGEEEGEEEEDAGTIDVLGYLDGPRGHELMMRILSVFEGARKATIDEAMRQRSEQIALDRYNSEQRSDFVKMNLRHTLWLKTIGLFVIAVAIIGLSVIDKLSPAAGTILGTIAGYILGQERRAA